MRNHKYQLRSRAKDSGNGLIWSGPQVSPTQSNQSPVKDSRSFSQEGFTFGNRLNKEDRSYSLKIVKQSMERFVPIPEIPNLRIPHREDLASVNNRVQINDSISQIRDSIRPDSVMHISHLWDRHLIQRLYFGTGLKELQDKIDKKRLHNTVFNKKTRQSVMSNREIFQDLKQENDNVVSNIHIELPEGFEPFTVSSKDIPENENEKEKGPKTPTMKFTSTTRGSTALPMSSRGNTGLCRTSASIRYLKNRRENNSNNLKEDSRNHHFKFSSQPTLSFSDKTSHNFRVTPFKVDRSKSQSTERKNSSDFLRESFYKVKKILEDPGSNKKTPTPLARDKEVSKYFCIENTGSIRLRQMGYTPKNGCYDIETVKEAIGQRPPLLPS